MKYANRHTLQNKEDPHWRITDDGFLRCTARVQQEKILKYTKEEMQDTSSKLNKDYANVFVSNKALSEEAALKSLEGVPVVAWEHTWTDTSVVKDVSVGSVAGAPKIENGFLVCDLLITDTKTIEQIVNKEIGEISAAYYADTVFESGEFNGESFDARQENLRYNHIAVIPVGTGRAGFDVRITNKLKKKESFAMADAIKLIRVQTRNSKKYMDMDEKSAEIYADEVKNMEEEMEEEEKKKKAVEDQLSVYVKNKDNPCPGCQESAGKLATYEQQIKNMNNNAVIEKAALGMLAEQEEAVSILKGSVLKNTDGSLMLKSDSEKYMNAIKSIHGDDLKKSVLTKIGINTTDKNSEFLEGAWYAKKLITDIQPPKVAGQRMLDQATTNSDLTRMRTDRQRLGIT